MWRFRELFKEGATDPTSSASGVAPSVAIIAMTRSAEPSTALTSPVANASHKFVGEARLFFFLGQPRREGGVGSQTMPSRLHRWHGLSPLHFTLDFRQARHVCNLHRCTCEV